VLSSSSSIIYFPFHSETKLKERKATGILLGFSRVEKAAEFPVNNFLYLRLPLHSLFSRAYF